MLQRKQIFYFTVGGLVFHVRFLFSMWDSCIPYEIAVFYVRFLCLMWDFCVPCEIFVVHVPRHISVFHMRFLCSLWDFCVPCGIVLSIFRIAENLPPISLHVWPNYVDIWYFGVKCAICVSFLVFWCHFSVIYAIFRSKWTDHFSNFRKWTDRFSNFRKWTDHFSNFSKWTAHI